MQTFSRAGLDVSVKPLESERGRNPGTMAVRLVCKRHGVSKGVGRIAGKQIVN